MTSVEATGGAPHTHYDPVASKIGMWLFLLTEVLLFGTMFIIFAVFFQRYTVEYHHAAAQLNRVIGAANTLVLLTSSLTIVLSLAALQRGEQGKSIRWMIATIVLSLVFLVVKGFEWSHKFETGIYLDSEVLLDRPKGEIIFFGLYFVMTGLHAVHVIIGAALIGVVARFVKAGKVHQKRISLLDNAALYWHLVDVIWIFLFPLFYLIGR